MFEELEKINTRPEPFEFYTASDLWTDEHMLKPIAHEPFITGCNTIENTE